MLNKVKKKFEKILKATAKSTYQYTRFRSAGSKTIGLIMGMQRSGTGMLLEAFDNDWRCKVYGEYGKLTRGQSAAPRMGLRWKPYRQVARIFNEQHSPLLIAKPLVESQCAELILQEIADAKIIWSYRHYQDVALSCRDLWGMDTIRLNLLPILEEKGDWFSENISDDVREIVCAYYSEERSHSDLWCLCWYVRNSIVLNYSSLPVKMTFYDHLVQNPVREMKSLYSFLKFPYPGDHIVKHIHTRSVRRGQDLEISADIRDLCDSLMSKLTTI